MVKNQTINRIWLLLPAVSVFMFTSCSEAIEKADEKWMLLNSKAEKLNSLINFERIKVEQLDSLVNKEMDKIQKLDSFVDSKSLKLDSLINN